MNGNGFGALQRDLSDVTRDLEDLSSPVREANEALADGVSSEAPTVSGYLAGSVVVDGAGVGVTAVYAGVVHDSNPYAERAVDHVDWLAPFADHVDDALDHLQRLYL